MRSWRFVAILALLATAACPGPNAGDLDGIAIIDPPGGGTGSAGASLTFFFQPSDARIGRPIDPAVRVQALDTLGNVLTTFTENVTVKLGVNPTGAALGGTRTVRASAGMAIFDTLVVDSVGRYTLVATAPDITAAASDFFSVFDTLP